MYNTIYPGYVQSYYNINRQQVKKKQEDEKNQTASQNGGRENIDNSERRDRQSAGAFYFPDGGKSAVDYTKKQIGIDDVLSDFRKTVGAIGTPENISSEVSQYLNLAESQSRKETPDSDIIRSNLKNASKILDDYIADTLKKPSKVVSEWVNTLMLQNIDYKSQIQKSASEGEIAENQQQRAEEGIIIEKAGAAPEKAVEKSQETHKASVNETEPPEEAQKSQKAQKARAQADIYMPSDDKLRRMFIQAKKYTAINRDEDALKGFERARDYAEKTGDEQTQAMIHFEEGGIYSRFNRPEEALYNYAITSMMTEDNSLRARTHLSMGKIYDDNVYFEPAAAHYSAAAGYAGEADNLKIQTKAFSDLANLHAQRYDKENADLFMRLAEISADETEDDKVSGYIYARNAKMQNKLGEKAKALSSYSASASSYSKLNDNESLAKDYREAALIMKSFGNAAKARTLLNKAYSAVQNTENAELKLLIMQDLEDVKKHVT